MTLANDQLTLQAAQFYELPAGGQIISVFDSIHANPGDFGELLTHFDGYDIYTCHPQNVSTLGA